KARHNSLPRLSLPRPDSTVRQCCHTAFQPYEIHERDETPTYQTKGSPSSKNNQAGHRNQYTKHQHAALNSFEGPTVETLAVNGLHVDLSHWGPRYQKSLSSELCVARAPSPALANQRLVLCHG